jgi:hypothetical protein
MAQPFYLRLSSLVLLPVLLIPVACMGIYFYAGVEQKGYVKPPTFSETFAAGDEFDAYWHAGLAEITSYRLQQARYGEMHEGTAMLMFVAEDFSTKALTKADGNNGPQMPVLKVNFEKKFVTGIYPYSMLLTVASPLNVDKHPLPLKVATSSQEWCGHTYTQLNLENGKYQMTEHSYFPGEGDQEKNIGNALPEDAIWTRLRIDPSKLPTGKFDLIPGTFFARLRHKPLQSQPATATIVSADSANLNIYQLDYVDGSRQVKIWYEQKFPFGIAQWEENYEEGWGPEAGRFTTRGTRMVTKKLAYWELHKNADRKLREELGL